MFTWMKLATTLKNIQISSVFRLVKFSSYAKVVPEHCTEAMAAPTNFRNRVTADGSSGFKAEAGRYHLYVALACPFANRAMLGRTLKGLEDVVSINILGFQDLEKGWGFLDNPEPPFTKDTVNSCKYLREIYECAAKDFTGRATVPVLWDMKENTIVNNESSDIMEMFSREFNALCKTNEQKALDLYPAAHRAEIDKLNEWIAPSINSGVYRAGFAKNQKDYEKAVEQVFEGLDKVEGILSEKRYLTGRQFTEADIRLFTSLIRFDIVYHGLFKCNKKMIKDYKNIWGFVRDVFSMEKVRATLPSLPLIMKHYWSTMTYINPTGVVPIGPALDYGEPHDRKGM